MAERLVGHYLLDIIDAVDGATAAVQGHTFESFRANWTVRHAVQRVIATRPEIPWPQVRGIGNILRHEYRGVDDAIVWRVVTQDLPPLRVAAQANFDALDEDPEA